MPRLDTLGSRCNFPVARDRVRLSPSTGTTAINSRLLAVEYWQCAVAGCPTVPSVVLLNWWN